jgi:hypothetical protein
MKKIGPNKYECDNPEVIRITFRPSKKNNVQVRQKWDGNPPQPVNINTGITESFTGSQRKVVLSFGFIQQGTCDFDIAGSNGVVDTKTVTDTGNVGIRRLTFDS